MSGTSTSVGANTGEASCGLIVLDFMAINGLVWEPSGKRHRVI